MTVRRGEACDSAFSAALARQWAGAFDDEHDIDDSQSALVPLWSGSPGDGPEDLRSCLAAIGYFVASRVAAGRGAPGPRPGTVQVASSRLGRQPDCQYVGADWFKQRAWEILAAGQFKNDGGRSAFERCRLAVPEDDFWYQVLTTATGPADFGQARIHLRWQHDNNPSSIARTLHVWGAPDAVPGTFQQIHAIYLLLLGQRHHEGRAAVAEYRGCFVADKTAFLRLVANPA